MITTELNQEPIGAVATVCEGCGQTLQGSTDAKFCGNCGFPANDTPEAKKKFIGRLKVKRIELEEEHAKINKVRTYLFVIAGFTFISGFIYSAMSDNGAETILLIILNTIIAAMFLTLGLLVRKHALPVCIIGLSLYASIILLNAFFDPMSILKGIIFKGLIISAMIYGIIASRKAKVLESELLQYKNIKLL